MLFGQPESASGCEFQFYHLQEIGNQNFSVSDAAERTNSSSRLRLLIFIQFILCKFDATSADAEGIEFQHFHSASAKDALSRGKSRHSEQKWIFFFRLRHKILPLQFGARQLARVSCPDKILQYRHVNI